MPRVHSGIVGDRCSEQDRFRTLRRSNSMEEVSALLEQWGMKSDVIHRFEVAEIDQFALQHMPEKTIQRLIPTEGQQIRFHAQRQTWLKTKVGRESKQAGKDQHLQTLASEQNRTTVLAVMDLNSNVLNVCNDGQLPTIIMEGDDISPSDENLCSLQPIVENLTQARDSGTGRKESEAHSSSVTVSSFQKNRAASYDLNALLKKSDNGKCVRAKYGLDSEEEPETENENGKQRRLDDHHQNLLATAIIEEELRHDASTLLSWDRMSFLGDAIKAHFPTESKNTYVNKTEVGGKSVLKGKLYFKYYNKRRAYRNSGLIKTPQPAKKMKITSGSYVIDPEIEGDILWLTQNASPWSDVKELWVKTAKARRSQLMKHSDKPIHDYTSMFPALQEPEGYRLLEMDFLAHDRTKDKKMSFLQAWPRLSSFVIKIIRQTIPDFLQDSTYTPNEKIVHVLMNIASVFKTITISRGKRTKGIKQWRPTTVECQDAFLLHIETISLLHEKMEQRRQKMATMGLKLQPQAVIVGPLECPTQSLVVIDNFHYEVKSVARAIDITFKSFHALHAKYPPEAEQIWLFLQRAVYGFDTEYDKTFTNVETRLADFEQC